MYEAEVDVLVLHTENVARGGQTESFQNEGGTKVYTKVYTMY